MEDSYIFSPKDVDQAFEIFKKHWECLTNKGPEPTGTECEYEALVGTAYNMFVQNKAWPTLGEVLALEETAPR